MIKKSDFLSLVRKGSFRELFISELGWNRYRGQEMLPTIIVDDEDYNISALAERSGFQILYCEVDTIPTQSIAKKIDTKLRRQAADYICIYRLRGGNAHDLWVVPIRTNEKRDIVLVEYEDAKAELLYSKIEGISFALDEVSNIVDLRNKVQGAFAVNSEKITKDFYSGFKKEHKAFADFITGIDDHVATKDNRNKQWYTSVMLNRLMFCYFIQKKGFLNLDHDYLRNKLNWVRQEQGENRFFKSFYRGFLSNLFHGGLNSPTHSREFEQMYGKIPYLNGGMFDEHQLERDYVDIDIADEAFIRLFDFFDTWRWHLDTRLTASGRDINPDVLGYIFEQYINDRAQMGAYYTKEDITEYIGRNCILPFLFDEVRRTAADDGKYFAPDGYVWKTLSESGDRYIFDAVKKGYCDFDSIPENISRGIITNDMHHEYAELSVSELPSGHRPLAELRSDWNTKTPEQWGLPAEIWRETIERLSRCRDILGKIERGEITSINDFITYNLDIRSFANDLIAAGDSRFVGRFYHALQKVTILDPTCGSGAFLFAAMNILEPLYEICIERMQDFNSKNPQLFKDELAEISNKYRSNIQYFIFKSIILRNLYGVDIMVEATEIAKLRLFLKMVAVVDVDRRAQNLGLDPLPDIDFNIRCGNTLVGYANKEELDRDLNDSQGDMMIMLANEEFKAKIDEEMKKVSATYNIFKSLQLTQDEDRAAFKQAKHDLRVRLAKLNEQLNLRLHSATSSEPMYAWLKSHQPFHWLAEFYQIIVGNGGFDVIIGNPPYVEYNKKDSKSKRSVADIYQIKGYTTITCGNLYAYVIERCLSISNNRLKLGVIIPSSSICTPRMEQLAQLLQSNSVLWTSLWDERPSTLFDGVCLQLSIQIYTKAKNPKAFVSSMFHWSAEERTNIFKSVCYAEIDDNRKVAEVTPKVKNDKELHLIDKMSTNARPLSIVVAHSGEKGNVYYKNAGGRYWRLIKSFPTYYQSDRGETTSTEKKISVPKKLIPIVVTSLSSSLFYWYWRVVSNCRHLTNRELDTYPISQSVLNSQIDFENLFNLFENDLKKYKTRSSTNSISKGQIEQDFYYVKYSKPIIDEIDRELAKHYGFTEEDLDFIINYDIKYRMGDELNSES